MAAVDRMPDMDDNEIPKEHKRGLQNYQEVKKDNKPIKYGYLDAFKDYMRQFVMNDTLVEEKLLSVLPFYPESDGKRKAQVIDTPISNNNYIHEFCIENLETSNTSKDGQSQVKDIVLIHGYAASLGLFFGNFDALSSIPGVRIHAIDLLGFGFSSRPSFPNFKYSTVEEVEKIEDWFIDAIEEWREKRNINNFILMGHSFGGYLSSCYTMKYNKKINDTQNLVDKLVLISPVGVERNKFSLLKNIPNRYFNDDFIKSQNKNDTKIPLENEMLQDQESITPSKPNLTINPKYQHIDLVDEDADDTRTKRRKLFEHLWAKNVSPIQLFRIFGPFKPKLINVWTSRRFSTYYETNPEIYKNILDYFYRTLNSKGSGEYAITRVLDIGALPRVPLIDRLPQAVEALKTPTLLLYGDVDWMNVEAGMEMSNEINDLASRNQPKSKISYFNVIKNAGHHVYLDNPDAFHRSVFKFIGYKP